MAGPDAEGFEKHPGMKSSGACPKLFILSNAYSFHVSVILIHAYTNGLATGSSENSSVNHNSNFKKNKVK